MKNKLSIPLYWRCQVIGWSVASLYWGYLGFTGRVFNFWFGLLLFITDVTFYILLTHLYRNFALRHNWQNSDLKQIIKRIIPAIVVMGLAFAIVTIGKLWLAKRCFFPSQSQPFDTFLQLNGLAIFMTGIRLMSIWLLAYHLYHFAQREIRITKENAQLIIISRDAQLSNLSAQLNPHFLFNSLNNIKSLVIENPQLARRSIDLLSELLRSGLYNDGLVLTTVHDELNLVQDYLELEKLRLEHRLQQHIEIDEKIANMPILRLCIQTLVENAVKHGIARQKDGGLIDIKLARHHNFIKITVSNPGRFDDTQTTAGIGLKILRERMALQYKGLAKFEITGNPDGTVLSSLLIPIP